ncbi:hypothetical protein GCM10023165_31860 [Variovorax defluvii]|uniref:Uncharacterized protein n=1 Tax=Variovorax defluvii TaxID=913761 RepID=A0ABP8HXZ2_9BURK
MKIFRPGSQASVKGPAEYITGMRMLEGLARRGRITAGLQTLAERGNSTVHLER